MSLLPPRDLVERMQAAAGLLQAGRAGEAAAVLSPLVQADPRIPDARHLLGLALEAVGQLPAAEAETRAAIALDKKKPPYHGALGDILRKQGRQPEAERAYRTALALDRRYAPAAVALSQLLLQSGRAAEAVQALTPLAVPANASAEVLAAYGAALKAANRYDDALAAYRRAVEAAPRSGAAEHNVAATLGDLGRHEETVAATGRAFAKGVDAPETWLVRARALQGLRRLDEAETAYREALRRRPGYAEAHRDLAQLVWMRTEDVVAATAALDAALRSDPGNLPLIQHKAKVLEFAGDAAGAYETLRGGLATDPQSVALHGMAAHAAVLLGEAEQGLAHAERALALQPQDRSAQLMLCETALAAGKPERVAEITGRLRQETPFDQYVLALQATAWRLLGDPRYRGLYDYGAFVRAWWLDTPEGWPSLEAYLADLTRSLHGQHPFKTHPLEQSLRHGSQASHLTASTDPAIRAFFQAVDGPIRRHIAALGKGKDPVRGRSRGGYAFQGVWSVRLRPNGYHADHVHPEGWLSSACYIELPQAVEAGGREGWIKFGEPGVATRPKLEPEHFVKPEPGLLVLFPSYMWHGTVPFSGDATRLTVAFDLVPTK